jgi:CTD small phosphatase-like protein 2
MAINLRPDLRSFLSYVSKIYEVIVFTSSKKSYADAVLDYIDPTHTLIHHRLYREHCLRYSEDFYIKDLRIMNRNLKNVIIVDNAPYAFAYQLDNGYPIIPFVDNKNEEELKTLATYLELIVDSDDIREMNKEKFKLQWLCSINIEAFLKYYIRSSDVSIETMQINLERSFSSYFGDIKKEVL